MQFFLDFLSLHVLILFAIDEANMGHLQVKLIIPDRLVIWLTGVAAYCIAIVGRVNITHDAP